MEKSRLKIGVEWGGLIGGITAFIMLIGTSISHFTESRISNIQQISEIIKVQAQHETRIDLLERENVEQRADSNRFQDQMNMQMIRMQDKVDKIYEVVKGGK